MSSTFQPSKKDLEAAAAFNRKLERRDKGRQAKEVYRGQEQTRTATNHYSLTDMLSNLSKVNAQKTGSQLGLPGRSGLQREPTHPSDPIEDFAASQQRHGSHSRRSVDRTLVPNGSSSSDQRTTSEVDAAAEMEAVPIPGKYLSDDSDDDAKESTTRKPVVAEKPQQPEVTAEQLEAQRKKAEWEAHIKRKEEMMVKQLEKDRRLQEAAFEQQQQQQQMQRSAPPSTLAGRQRLALKQESSPAVHNMQSQHGPDNASQAEQEQAEELPKVRKVLFQQEMAQIPAAEPEEEAEQEISAPRKRSGKHRAEAAPTNDALLWDLKSRMREYNRQHRSNRAEVAASMGIRAMHTFDPSERSVNATLEEMQAATLQQEEVGNGSASDSGEDGDFAPGSDEEDEEQAVTAEEGSQSSEHVTNGFVDAEVEEAGSEQHSADEDEDGISDKENAPPPGSAPEQRAEVAAGDDEDDGPAPVVKRHVRTAAATSDSEEEVPAERPQMTRSRSILGPIDLEGHNDDAQEDKSAPAGLKLPSSSQLMPPPQTMPGRGIQLGSTISFGAPTSDADDVLGQFFTQTQTDEPGAAFPSAEIVGRPPSILAASGEAGGFSQFFAETQEDPADAPVEEEKQEAGLDAFAALRQKQEAMVALTSEDALPSIDATDAERIEAEAADAHERQIREQRRAMLDTPKQYMNKHGFYTQTKPTFGGDESQSQDWLGDTPVKGFFEDQDWSAHESEAKDDTPAPIVKRKFRLGNRASPTPSPRRSPVQRPVEEQDTMEADVESAGEEEEEEAPPSPSPTHAKKRTYFDVMMDAATTDAAGAVAQKKQKQQKSVFVEGEAEEDSEDDMAFLGTKRKDRTMGGIFSDDDEKEDEGDEDDEDDGKDLEGLVDDEKDADEALKNKLMRERAKVDEKADDEALQKKMQRIVDGKWRAQMRHGNALEDLLDEDAEDEEILRRLRAQKAAHESKRVIEGGDDLDALRESGLPSTLLNVTDVCTLQARSQPPRHSCGHTRQVTQRSKSRWTSSIRRSAATRAMATAIVPTRRTTRRWGPSSSARSCASCANRSARSGGARKRSDWRKRRMKRRKSSQRRDGWKRRHGCVRRKSCRGAARSIATTRATSSSSTASRPSGRSRRPSRRSQKATRTDGARRTRSMTTTRP